MNQQDLIRKPIASELDDFDTLFRTTLESEKPLLQEVLAHIARRTGKRMRPILMLLMAKCCGGVTERTLHAAVALELLHTASLVHDDVVDDSTERRGQPSVNATFGNKLSVLVGDYLLSTALFHAAQTGDVRIIRRVAHLGQMLSEGEILQLSAVSTDGFSEEVYFDIIRKKTAVLFETCASLGALSAGAGDDRVEWAGSIGELIGMAFQIKDDIFDYSADVAAVIGKPTGNDMHEGKLTLPVLHALIASGDEEMAALARKVRHQSATDEEIARLVAFTASEGGIDYARRVMVRQQEEVRSLLTQCPDEDVRLSLCSYMDYVVERNH